MQYPITSCKFPNLLYRSNYIKILDICEMISLLIGNKVFFSALYIIITRAEINWKGNILIVL